MQNNLHLNFLSVLYSKTKMRLRLKFDDRELRRHRMQEPETFLFAEII